MILKLNTISQDVAAWQKYLGLPETGIFDEQVKAATQKWQAERGLDPDGIVGPKTYAAAGITFKQYYPPRPQFNSPTNTQREQMFGKFSWVKKNATEITITGDWVQKNIIKVAIPQLIGVSGAPKDGGVYFHRKGAEALRGFFNEVEAAGLLHLVVSWAGAFYPRFIRGSSSTLSNHSWGTAFDINAPQNWLGQQPAAEGRPGSLLRLVPIANKWGFFWGGHYNSRLDGMHFELARMVTPSLVLDLPKESAVSQPAKKVITDSLPAIEPTVDRITASLPTPAVDRSFTAYIPQIDTAKTMLKTLTGFTSLGTVGAFAAGLPDWLIGLMIVLLAIVIIGGIVILVRYHREVFAYVRRMNELRADPNYRDPELSSDL